MATTLTIPTYHFVRDLKNSRYPAIKGLDLEAFRGQLEYLKKHYTFITVQDILDVLDGRRPYLPDCAALLTFDDGYIDHFINVFPLLDEMRIQGCFFPPAKAIQEHRVLDVNKIHFILASIDDPRCLVKDILEAVDAARKEYDLAEGREYLERLSTGHRYDPPEIIFVKRMLQRELPEPLRKRLLDQLFSRYVTTDESVFAHDLYMSMDQLRCMQRHGMFIGSHGYKHCWLDTLPREQQEQEIDLSLQFLRDVGVDLDSWVMCYPYGGYNESLLSILRERGCRLGLTVNVGLARPKAQDPLTLSRLDTNDLPKRADADLDPWTTDAIRREQPK